MTFVISTHMEFFGVTLAGYGNHISEVLRKDYKEPNKVPSGKEILEERLKFNPQLRFVEAYNKLDPFLGTGNGYSYGSYHRLRLQIKKGLTKPVGPTDMYRIPATTGQDWGFWRNDQLLANVDWTKITANYKMKSSELTKYAPVL